jgi:hypothetical protein
LSIIEESSRNARSQTAISEAGSQEGHSTAAFFEGLLEPTRHRIRERALVTDRLWSIEATGNQLG